MDWLARDRTEDSRLQEDDDVLGRREAALLMRAAGGHPSLRKTATELVGRDRGKYPFVGPDFLKPQVTR
jgi:hypothetical protein